MITFYYIFEEAYRDENFDGITVDYEFTPSEALLREAVKDFCHDCNVVIACDLSIDELETFIQSQSLCLSYCQDWLFSDALEECTSNPDTWELYKEALEDEYDSAHPLRAVGMSERDFM